MNMQQRRYLKKERLTPMKQQLRQHIDYMASNFKKYVCWGDLVRMIKSGELELKAEWYHRSIISGYLHATYDNPFGPKGEEMLGSSRASGIEVSVTESQRLKAEWDQRFKHAEDFLTLASEDTIIALLHNLEASVNEFCERAKEHYGSVKREQKAYTDWLTKQGLNHDYPS